MSEKTLSSVLFLSTLPLYSRSAKQWVFCQLVPLKTLPSLLSGMQPTGRQSTHTVKHTHTLSHNPRILIRFMSCNLPIINNPISSKQKEALGVMASCFRVQTNK